jgi:hypothetical protein
MTTATFKAARLAGASDPVAAIDNKLGELEGEIAAALGVALEAANTAPLILPLSDFTDTPGHAKVPKTGASVNTIAAGFLPTMVASGASHAAGAVPDPGATAGTRKFLCEDATFKEAINSSNPYVRVRLSADVPLDGLSGLDIPWDIEVSDASGFHEGVIHPTRIIVPTGLDGLYYYSFYGSVVNRTTTSTIVGFYTNFVGPSIQNASAQYMPGYISYGPVFNYQGIIRLSAGHYAVTTVMMGPSTVADLDLSGGTIGTWFEMLRIGS